MSDTPTIRLHIPEPVSLRESVTRLLLAQIMAEELIPGETYSVAQLAADLNVSPTPVREAVLDLTSKNLLVIHKNRGFSIPPITTHELEELHQIRLLLEVPSTVEAGMIMDEANIRAAEALAERSIDAARSDDLANYIALDRSFHSAFLKPLNMPHLTELVMNYRDRARLRGLRAKLRSSEIVAAAEQHLELVAAAAKKDKRALKQIITDHVQATKSRW